MQEIPLGKKTDYNLNYSQEILFPIERSFKTHYQNQISEKITGYDLWNAYEFSYLNLRGKPVNAILRLVYGCQSPCIIESKSLKLYLGSYSMMKFQSKERVIEQVKTDLEKSLQAALIHCDLIDQENSIGYTYWPKEWIVDHLEADGFVYQPDPGSLKTHREKTRTTLISHLLRTNCPVTGQPDWGTVFVQYSSENMLDRTSFLQYIVSYRDHQDFHETTCDRIMNDLLSVLNPDSLIVKCFYTRRGGIDINPCRFYGLPPDSLFQIHLWRQ